MGPLSAFEGLLRNAGMSEPMDWNRIARAGFCRKLLKSAAVWRAAGLALTVMLLVAPVIPAAAEEVSHEHLGLQLRGNLVVAPGKSLERDGVALVVHGTMAHHGMEIIRDLQANLQQRGISTLAVTLSLGLDNRSGMYDCALEHDHRHQDAVEEIAAWLAWLKEKGAGRVDLIGHSRGGAQVALFAAGAPAEFSGRLVLAAPLLDNASPDQTAARYEAQFGRPLMPLLEAARKIEESDADEAPLLEVPGFLNCRESRVSAAAFLDYYAGMRQPVAELLEQVKAPTLVVVAGADELVPGVADALEVPGVATRKISVVDGADHFFRDLYGEDLADAIATFLNRE